MSWKAAGYVKNLTTHPSTGETLTHTEKLVALILADYHNEHRAAAWPSVEKLAAECLMHRTTCMSVLAKLETGGVIGRRRPDDQGRGHITEYFFPALDAPNPPQKGSRSTTLPPVKNPVQNPPKGSGKGSAEAPKGSDLGMRNKEELKNLEHKTFSGAALPGNILQLTPPSPKTDARFSECREIVERWHSEAVGIRRALVWDGRCAKALTNLLKDKPSLTVDEFSKCARHYYRSDVNISQHPSKFIANCLEYAVGELNEFGRPRRFSKDAARACEGMM